MIHGKRVSLSRFFECAFAPYIPTQHEADTYRAAIRWFRRFLGREPTLLDLNKATVQGLVHWLALSGFGKAKLRKTCTALLIIWKAARLLRCASPVEVPTLAHCLRQNRRRCKPNKANRDNR